jgi:hypothetical protein
MSPRWLPWTAPWPGSRAVVRHPCRNSIPHHHGGRSASRLAVPGEGAMGHGPVRRSYGRWEMNLHLLEPTRAPLGQTLRGRFRCGLVGQYRTPPPAPCTGVLCDARPNFCESTSQRSLVSPTSPHPTPPHPTLLPLPCPLSHPACCMLPDSIAGDQSLGICEDHEMGRGQDVGGWREIELVDF